MTIVVNPHSKEEEDELLDFLERRRYDYLKKDDFILSDSQKKEILDRDKEFETGQTETYSLDDIITHFNIKDK